MNWKYPAIGITVGACVAVVGYFAYFDYKRRNDPEFRKELAKRKKQEKKDIQAHKKAEKEEELKKKEEAKAAEARKPPVSGMAGSDPLSMLSMSGLNVLEMSIEDISRSPKAETILQELLTKGDVLAQRGPENYDLAVKHLTKALRLIPFHAEELLESIRTNYPKELHTKLMKQLNDDELNDFKAYLNDIKPAEAKANFNEKFWTDPSKESRTALLDICATQDIAEGEVIYTESPFVSVLCSDLNESEYCYHTQKKLDVATGAATSEKGFVYASKDIRKNAEEDYERFFAPYSQFQSISPIPLMDALALKYYAKVIDKKNSSAVVYQIQTINFSPPSMSDGDKIKKFLSVAKSLLVKDKIEGMSPYEVLEKDEGSFVLIRSFLASNCFGFTVGDEKLRESNACTSLKDYFSASETKEKLAGVGFYPFSVYLKKRSEMDGGNVNIVYNSDHKISVVARKALKKGESLVICTSTVVNTSSIAEPVEASPIASVSISPSTVSDIHDEKPLAEIIESETPPFHDTVDEKREEEVDAATIVINTEA